MQPPIAEPHEISTNHFSGDDVSEFRFRFWPYFLATAFVSLVATGPILWAIISPVFALHPERLQPITAVFLLALVALNFVGCVLFYRVALLRINGWGLHAFNFWGFSHEVMWTQILNAKFKWFLLPYTIISTSSGQHLWIPLFLENPRGFAQSVATHTAPDHPLHEFLRQRGLLN